MKTGGFFSKQEITADSLQYVIDSRVDNLLKITQILTRGDFNSDNADLVLVLNYYKVLNKIIYDLPNVASYLSSADYINGRSKLRELLIAASKIKGLTDSEAATQTDDFMERLEATVTAPSITLSNSSKLRFVRYYQENALYNLSQSGINLYAAPLGTLTGTASSYPSNFTLTWPVSGDVSQISVSSGSAIDSNGEYIYSEEVNIYDASTFNEGDGTYGIFLSYIEENTYYQVDINNELSATRINDSYEINITKVTLSEPYIKIAEIEVLGGSITSLVDLRDYNSSTGNPGLRLNVAAVDKGIYMSSGSTPGWAEGWQKTLYDHVHAIGSGEVSLLNPHGAVLYKDWNDVKEPPSALYPLYKHGNAFSQFDARIASGSFTYPIVINGVTYYGQSLPASAHYQDVALNNYASPASGSVKVSRWGTKSYHSTSNTQDQVNGNNPYISSPVRQGGTTIWVDGYIVDNISAHSKTWTLDSKIDWRYRWIKADGYISWSEYYSKVQPGGLLQDKISGHLSRTASPPYFKEYSEDYVPGGSDPNMQSVVAKMIFYSYKGSDVPYYGSSNLGAYGKFLTLDGSKSSFKIYADPVTGALMAHVSISNIHQNSGDPYKGLSYGFLVKCSPQAEVTQLNTTTVSVYSWGTLITNLKAVSYAFDYMFTRTSIGVTREHLNTFSNYIGMRKFPFIESLRDGFGDGVTEKLITVGWGVAPVKVMTVKKRALGEVQLTMQDGLTIISTITGLTPEVLAGPYNTAIFSYGPPVPPSTPTSIKG